VTKRNGPKNAEAAMGDADVPNSTRVITAAAKLFREQTYALSTTRELSSRLGFNKASLYYYVSSKEELLYLICGESLRRVTEDVRQAVEPYDDPLDRLHAAFHAQLRSSLTDLDLHATMLLELRSLRDERRADVIRLRDQFEALMAGLVADAQHAGELRTDFPAKHLTLGMLSLVNWTISWYKPEGPLLPDELAAILWELFINGSGALVGDRTANQANQRSKASAAPRKSSRSK
jgi:AcrR family transcriptional regulator